MLPRTRLSVRELGGKILGITAPRPLMRAAVQSFHWPKEQFVLLAGGNTVAFKNAHSLVEAPKCTFVLLKPLET